MKRLLQSLIVFSCFSWLNVASAQTINIPLMGTSLVGQALYSSAPEPDLQKPVILVLHGFSATHNYPTVVALHEFLNFSNYTTLTPTLTMNISMRSQPLSCNSLHTNTLENDIAELHMWIQWLEQQGHQNIILFGHSSGSQTILEALHRSPPITSIKGVVLTSLFYLAGEELGNRPADKQRALQRVKQADPRPLNFSFLFCQDDYFATPESYLSFLTLTRKRVLSTLNSLSYPSFTIMGSADTRYNQVGRNWLEELEQSQTSLYMIEDANHFFLGREQSRFQDQVLQILQQLGAME